MLSIDQPDNFHPKFEIVSCFVEFSDKILLLLRQDSKPQPNTYGAPAGKVEPGETLEGAMLRELHQETGLRDIILRYHQVMFVRYPAYDFLYHIFTTHLQFQPKILIHPEEHKQYAWVTPSDAFGLPLIPDMDTCIRTFYML